MNEEYTIDPYRCVPPRVRESEGKFVADWELEFEEPVDSQSLAVAAAKAPDEKVFVNLKQLDARRIVLSTSRDRSVLHAYAYDAAMRGILLLEKYVGLISRIQGGARKDWRYMLAHTDNVGALERDKTPLMKASKEGDIRIVKSLVESGAATSINETSPSGLTAIMYAAFYGHMAVVKELQNHGADVNLWQGDQTALQLAVIGGIELVKELLNAGAKINAVNRYQETALMWAAGWNSVDVINLLIDRGADASLRDNEGCSALDLALQNKKMDAADLLGRLAQS